MRNKLCTVLALFLIVLLGTGCAEETITGSHYALDTILTFSLYDTKDETLLQALRDRTNELEACLSRTEPGSDIDRINNAGGLPVKVAPETAELISACLEVSEASAGAFDITVGRITELWDFSAETPELPGEEALRDALKTVGWRQVRVDGCTVTVPDGVKLDLGAAAKGYIGDRLTETLEERGCRTALLNLGGNLITVGSKKKGPWRLGIRDPQKGKDDSLCILALPGTASLVTSGVYERYFELNGKHYHHILDPMTGYPVENGLASVTVLAASSAEADMLSTACFVLGEDKARMILRDRGAEALFVYEDGGLSATEGMRNRIENR